MVVIICAASIGASFACDIGQTVASTARSYSRKKWFAERSRAQLAPTAEKNGLPNGREHSSLLQQKKNG